MKNNESKINKRVLIYLFFMVALFSCTVAFSYSCTSPDAVYAAEEAGIDPMRQITIKGPVFEELKDAVKPDLTLKQGDALYQLVSTELTEVSVEGMRTYVSASVLYELEGQQNPPETTIVTLYDEYAECEYKRELTYLDMRETEVLWEKTFSFPITVSGYDAEGFLLGNELISKDEELIHYADHILESMGLSKEYYHIHTITWNGEAYETEGEMVREALAEGEKLIRRVEVTYGGEIKTPDTSGYQYISIYETQEKKEEIKESTNIENTEAHTEETNISTLKEGVAEQIQRFLQEHMTIVTVSSLFILFLMGMIYLWWKSRKNEKSRKAGN